MPTCIHGDNEAICEICSARRAGLAAAGQATIPVVVAEGRHIGARHRLPAGFVSPKTNLRTAAIHEAVKQVFTDPDPVPSEKPKKGGWVLNKETGRYERKRKAITPRSEAKRVAKQAFVTMNEVSHNPEELIDRVYQEQQARARDLNARLTPEKRSENARKAAQARIEKAASDAMTMFREPLLEAAMTMIKQLDAVALGRVVNVLAVEFTRKA